MLREGFPGSPNLCTELGDRYAAASRVVGTVRVWVDDREDKPTAVAQGTYVLPASG